MNFETLILITVMSLSVFGLLWVYVLYGLVLRALKRYFRPVVKGTYYPTLTIIIPAYNEERIIEKKIANTLSLEYPKDRLETIVVDDGSSDNTYEISKRIEGVKTFRINRGGKNKAINSGLRMASGEVVVQTDADCFSTKKDALLKLSEDFADPSVGAVTAGVSFLPSKSKFISKFLSGQGIPEQNTSYFESQLDSVSSGMGVFLAFRRELVSELHEECLADDVDISLQVRAKGFRVVYEPELAITTSSPDDLGVWYKQYLRRTLSGLVTLIQHKSMLFNRRLGWYGLVILPTKSLLIHLTPLFCLGCIIPLAILCPTLAAFLVFGFLLLSLFSFLMKKFLIVQVVQLHVFLVYLLGRYGPKYWVKEPRAGT
jgi:cellulose synthase/poly-beta-1,6-N-acetylglucosamine synthase-like glycosyltransferase